MAVSITPAIPASQIVQVLPSVLSPGGIGIQLNGMMLTPNTRVPAGQVLSFPTANSVSQYFGPTAQETALAQIYFLGFDTSTQKPSNLYFYQYAWQFPVPAYLRGGSMGGITLSNLQGMSGQLTVPINGTPVTASISLAGATSFSSAASMIGAGLGISGLNQGQYAGFVNGNVLTVGTVSNGPQQAAFVGSITGGTLTVTSMNWGTLFLGALITGSGILGPTTITAFQSGQGGVGTYTVSPQTVASTQMQAYAVAGAIALGDVVVSGTIAAGLYVTGLITGTGGLGTYQLSGSGVFANGTFQVNLPGVTFDPVLSAFNIYTPTAGGSATIGYASGPLAGLLNLTQSNGAIISAGANQSTPATAMTAITNITTNWALFMTLFEPISSDKIAFAQWTNSTNNQFGYAMWDSNVANTQSGGGPSPAVAAILLSQYSGTCMLYANPSVDTIGMIAAFVLGYAASINFYAIQGRATAAFKRQSGLTPQVFGAAIAANLQSNGMNFYGDYTTANQQFNFLYPGSVSGPFIWLDSYIDQIWFNAQLQVALMELLTQINSIPYNQFGYGLIQNACLDPITQAVNAGVIQPGIPLSGSQRATVNDQAGAVVDGVISTRGWFLQIQPATPQVRLARTTPPILLWYTDGGSVQQITLNSIDVQ